MASTSAAESPAKKKTKKSKAIEKASAAPDALPKPKKEKKLKSEASTALFDKATIPNLKQDEVSVEPKPKKGKKSKLKTAEVDLPAAASGADAETDLTSTGPDSSLAMSIDATPAKTKAKKGKKKPKQEAELKTESAGAAVPARAEDLPISPNALIDVPAPSASAVAGQPSPKKKEKKKAKQQQKAESEKLAADMPESLASPAKKQKKSSAVVKSENPSAASDAAAEEDKRAADLATAPAASEQEAVKKPKKKKKAAKEMPAQAAQETDKTPASLEEPDAVVREPTIAPIDAQASKKAKKKKPKSGGAVAEIAQIDAEVQARLAAAVQPLSEAPAEGTKKSRKKRKKDQAIAETVDGSTEIGAKKKKRKVAAADASGATPQTAQAVELFTGQALPAVSEEEIQDAAQDGKAAGMVENELAKQMEAEAIVSPAETRKGTAAKAFQRVKADEWMHSKAARNNSYEATFGNQGWGAKAQEVLGQVRGKDFRHEKTKKKRGSYRGGAINNAVNSFKFESDEE